MRYEGFLPSYDGDANILILGSFPSVMSRANAFYYGNPRNRFWKLLAKHYGEELPLTNDEKIAFLRRHRIALWDIVMSCEIEGSSDSSIRSYEVADIYEVIKNAGIKRILLNGGTAAKIFRKHYPELTNMAIELPSTSPANFRFDEEAWLRALDIGTEK